MKKEINLENILKSKLTVETMLVNSPDYTWNKTIEAMKEACKQSIELCAKNAAKTCSKNSDYRWDQFENYKQSILNTINEII